MTPSPGLQFTERLCGALARVSAEDPAAGGDLPRDAAACVLTVTVTARDLARLLEDPQHRATVLGTLEAPALSDVPLMVTEGTLELLVRDLAHVHAFVMRYHATLTARGGARYALEGVKRLQRHRPGADLWRDTTILAVTVRRRHGAGPVVARGTLRIRPADLRRQLATLRVTGARTPRARVEAWRAVGLFFVGALAEVYGRGVAPSRAVRSDGPRPRRALRAPAPEPHDVQTVDGVRLRLTRYRGGPKGPVLLSPGFGTTAAAFALDTVDTNLTEYDGAVIVTSDGDFACLVRYLYERGKLERVLSPNRKRCSVLLKRAAREKLDFLDAAKGKIAYKR